MLIIACVLITLRNSSLSFHIIYTQKERERQREKERERERDLIMLISSFSCMVMEVGFIVIRAAREIHLSVGALERSSGKVHIV